MEYTNALVNSIFENMLNGFAYHRIVTDEDGKPVDYIYLDANRAFEELTGLKKEEIIGKGILEIVPEIIHDDINWIEFFGNIAINEESAIFEQHSGIFNKWYLVNAFSPQKGYFIAIFIDITELKLREIDLNDKNTELSRLFNESMDQQEELRKLIEISENTQKNLLINQERNLIAQSLASVGNWEINLLTKEVWGSREAFRLYGLKRETPYLPLELIQGMVDPADRRKMDKALEDLLFHEKSYDVEFRLFRNSDNTEIYLHSVARLIKDENGKPIKVAGAIQDITKRVLYENRLKAKNEEITQLYEEVYASEEELTQKLNEIIRNKELLELSEAKYSTLLNNTDDLIYSCDCNGIFNAVNNRFCDFLNKSIDEIIGKKIEDIIEIDQHFSYWYETHRKAIDLRKSLTLEKAATVKGEEKYYQINTSPIIGSLDEVIGVTGFYHDITTIKKNEKTILHMAYHDALTGLPNRLLFSEHLTQKIASAAAQNEKFAVVFFDLDDFKKINDTLGHAFGDELLKEVATRLKCCINTEDTVSRLGGDEFALIINQLRQNEDVLLCIHRLQKEISEPFALSEQLIDMSVSIGISIFPNDALSVEDLLKNADTAMYRAKEEGKNKYVFFDTRMREKVFQKTRIETLLKKGIKEDEFLLYFQPQYSAIGRKLRGFEALIRWNSPELGFMNPGEFIQVAEETGLIIPIGQWVLREACLFIKKINESYNTNLIISINISPIQLRQKSFGQIVLDTIAETGIPSSWLELEVTENLFIDNYERTNATLNTLRENSIGIALDDFGTGYSSLSYLRELPINILKIDKAFISEICSHNTRYNLTESIISLAHKMGIEIIAEGVETVEQLNYLISVDCDYIQGYYWGRPEAEENLRQYLEL